MVVLGLPMVAAAILCYLFLPETRNENLPQSMEEAVKINLKTRKMGKLDK